MTHLAINTFKYTPQVMKYINLLTLYLEILEFCLGVSKVEEDDSMLGTKLWVEEGG